MGAAIPAPRSPHCAWEPADLGGTFEPHGGMGELCPWPQPCKHFAFVLLMYFQGFSCDGDETQSGLFCVTGGVGMSEQGWEIPLPHRAARSSQRLLQGVHSAQCFLLTLVQHFCLERAPGGDIIRALHLQEHRQEQT